MTETSPNNSAVANPPQIKPRTWAVPMAIVGLVAVYWTMMAAGGSGWSPLVFILFGLIGTPLIARCLRRFMSQLPWTSRLNALLIAVTITFFGSLYSVRISPSDAYKRTLFAAPPADVTLQSARQAWYDGEQYALHFHAERPAVDAMLASQHFEAHDTQSVDGLRRSIELPFFNMADVLPAMMGHALWWQTAEDSLPDKYYTVDLVWQPSTGDGVIIGRHY